MLIKLIAVGTLGYIGFKMLQSAESSEAPRRSSPADLRIAGGPLSPQATLQHSADFAPAQPG